MEIKKDYASKSIVAIVSERERSGIWCFPRENSEACWWFDDEGVLFARSSGAAGNLILVAHDISGDGFPENKRPLTPEGFSNFLSIAEILEVADLNVRRIEVEHERLHEVRVAIHEGPMLYFSTRFAPKDLLAGFSAVGERADFPGLEYVDFRVEGRVYYK